MITKAKATSIKDKILDLKEKIQAQKFELQTELETKKKVFHDTFNNSSDKELIAHTYSIGVTLILDIFTKGNAHRLLQESLKANESLRDKRDLIENIYKQVNERLSIIEKAEFNDLEDFLKENDVYSIFKGDKLEKFINKENLLLDSYKSNKKLKNEKEAFYGE